MKKIIMSCAMLFIAGIVIAQQPLQFYGVEDHVKPSMDGAYRNWLKKVKETYEKQQVNLTYDVFVQDDNTYYFFTPMERFNLPGLFKSFGEVRDKVGSGAFESLFMEKGKYVESNLNFITEMLPQYTYLAPAEGENFRHMMFWFPLPGMEKEVDQIAKEWIDLHNSKNAPRGYQTFKSVLGGDPGYVIVTWGKGPIDQLTKANKTSELFGEAGAQLWSRTMAITRKIFYKNAWHLPALSYSHKAPVIVK